MSECFSLHFQLRKPKHVFGDRHENRAPLHSWWLVGLQTLSDIFLRPNKKENFPLSSSIRQSPASRPVSSSMELSKWPDGNSCRDHRFSPIDGSHYLLFPLHNSSKLHSTNHSGPLMSCLAVFLLTSAMASPRPWSPSLWPCNMRIDCLWVPGEGHNRL